MSRRRRHRLLTVVVVVNGVAVVIVAATGSSTVVDVVGVLFDVVRGCRRRVRRQRVFPPRVRRRCERWTRRPVSCFRGNDFAV